MAVKFRGVTTEEPVPALQAAIQKVIVLARSNQPNGIHMLSIVKAHIFCEYIDRIGTS